MGRKTNSTKGKKSTTKKAPRRSSSQFTPVEAVAVRDSRPTAVVWNEKRSVYVVTYDGKKAGEAHSMSGARRLRARIERDKGYALTPAKKKAALKAYDKARA